MKLKDIDIIVTAPPPPGWGGRYFIFVKLTTACGVVGYGEVYAASVGPAAMEAVIRDVFDRHMADENPENIELMFRRAYSSGFTQRPDLTVMGAFSGLEMACWDILGKKPDDVMCASSRMVVKRRGAAKPSVLACTLLAYDPEFELGTTLAEAEGSVQLNHKHCAKFCVLGGASCSA